MSSKIISYYDISEFKKTYTCDELLGKFRPLRFLVLSTALTNP